MSIKVMNMVWSLKHGALTTAQRFVLLALADTASDEGHCFPSVAYICNKVDLTDRVVRGHLDALENAGWFSRHRRVRGWRATGYEYNIDMVKLDEYRLKPATSTGRNQPVKERLKPAGQERLKPAGHIHNHQGVTPSSEPSTTTSPPKKTNQFAGKCMLCECYVEAREGRLVGKDVAHRPGECSGRVGKMSSSANERSAEDWTR